MVNPRKKQTGFYATPQVEKYLAKLEDGVKTKRINEILSETIGLEEFGLITYHCHHCMRPATGKPISKFTGYTYFQENGLDYHDDSYDIVVVQCPHSADCGNSSLLKATRELIGPNDEYQYERLYPEPEKLEGVPSRFTRNLKMAEAAYFNQDCNAVALYCRRILFDIFKELELSSSANEALDEMEATNRLSRFERQWAEAIDRSTRSVTETNSEMRRYEAQLCLFFTRKLLESVFVLHEGLENFEKQTTLRLND